MNQNTYSFYFKSATTLGSTVALLAFFKFETNFQCEMKGSFFPYLYWKATEFSWWTFASKSIVITERQMTSIYFLRWLMTLLPLAPNSTFPISQEFLRLLSWVVSLQNNFCFSLVKKLRAREHAFLKVSGNMSLLASPHLLTLHLLCQKISHAGLCKAQGASSKVAKSRISSVSYVFQLLSPDFGRLTFAVLSRSTQPSIPLHLGFIG